MTNITRTARGGAAAFLLLAAAACSSTGGLGSILGSVLGGGGGNQVSGTIQNVDTQYRQVAIRQSNGQSVALSYDNNTQVVYQNQNYPVTSLEYGDEVTARVASTSGNSSYTDLIQVTRSVGNSGSGGVSGNVQTFDGTVRSIDRSNGLFGLTSNNYGTLTVSMPFNARSSDLTRFQNLRTGDFVRIYGVMLNNSRVELRQFY